ncbi:MAG: hypothetical protein JST01_20960 [Cyanobacteria bacterium SZAS TMP-1]|nr:hypothetical protein [Cyanobacteria bacterium SZAS TMP-1]
MTEVYQYENHYRSDPYEPPVLDPAKQAGQALYEAVISSTSRNFVDPSGIDRVLDQVGDTCAIRQVTKAASLLGKWNTEYRYSIEENKARNEETLVIEEPFHTGYRTIHKYTQSPICQETL